MRAVLIVVFWAWLAVSLAVYGYRLWRRVTQGPKAVREARAATEEGRAAGLGDDWATAVAPTTAPLPEPVSRGDDPPPAASRSTIGDVPRVASSPPGRTTSTPTVAEALAGIDLPCDLAPIADVTAAENAGGRRVVFTTRASDVPGVAASLAHELENLGYEVSDAPTDTAGARRRLIATRADATVSVALALDAMGVVTAEVST